MVRYEVVVQLKKEVLDPQGRAIKETIQRLGHNALQDVKVSKRFELELSGADADKKAEEIAHEFLANPVSETYVINKIEE